MDTKRTIRSMNVKQLSIVIGLITAVGLPVFGYGQLDNQVEKNKDSISEVKEDLKDDLAILRDEQKIVREDIKELLRNSRELKNILESN